MSYVSVFMLKKVD